MALPCTELPCTEASDVPGLNRGLQLAVPSHRRELPTAVSTSAALTSALANTAVSRIVLASGTYNLIAELNITRSVILEAATGATVTLNAQPSYSSPRRVLTINPGPSGVVQLIGLGITGCYVSNLCSLLFKSSHHPTGKIADVLAPTHAWTTANASRSTTVCTCHRDLAISHRPHVRLTLLVVYRAAVSLSTVAR
jgi:hypothetical protein